MARGLPLDTGPVEDSSSAGELSATEATNSEVLIEMEDERKGSGIPLLARAGSEPDGDGGSSEHMLTHEENSSVV